MNVSYGGKAVTMRETVVPEIGHYNAILTVGDIQRMQFIDTNPGPFWMSTDKALSSKYDVISPSTKVREKTKVELLVELNSKGVDTTTRRYMKNEIVSLC